MESRAQRLFQEMQGNSGKSMEERDLIWEQWIQEPEAMFEVLKDPTLSIKPTDNLRQILNRYRRK